MVSAHLITKLFITDLQYELVSTWIEKLSQSVKLPLYKETNLARNVARDFIRQSFLRFEIIELSISDLDLTVPFSF